MKFQGLSGKEWSIEHCRLSHEEYDACMIDTIHEASQECQKVRRRVECLITESSRERLIVAQHETSLESLAVTMLSGVLPGNTVQSSNDTRDIRHGDIYLHVYPQFFKKHVPHSEMEGPEASLNYAQDLARTHYVAARFGVNMSDEFEENSISELRCDGVLHLSVLEEKGLSDDDIFRILGEANERKGVRLHLASSAFSTSELLPGDGVGDVKINKPDGLDAQHIARVEYLGVHEQAFRARLRGLLGVKDL